MFLMLNCNGTELTFLEWYLTFLEWYLTIPSIIAMIITFIVLSFVFGYFQDDINKNMKDRYDSEYEDTPLIGFIFLAFCISFAWIIMLVVAIIVAPSYLGKVIRKKKDKIKNNEIKMNS